MAEKEEPVNLKITPEMPTSYPVIDDLVGDVNSFAVNFLEGLEYKGIYEQLGIQPDKSYILNGPPGTGKTFSIQAINNTTNQNVLKGCQTIEDINHNLQDIDNFKLFVISYDIGNFGTAYINRGSRIVQSFFDQIKFISLRKPVLIQFDEADALFMSRKSNVQGHSEDKKVLETLMKNLQEVHDLPDIYVVMMTNLQEQMDDAALRAGRIDRRYNVKVPSYEERMQLFEKRIMYHNSRCSYSVIRNYDLQKLANLSEGFNHADVVACLEKCLRNKAKQLIRDKEPGIKRLGYVTQTKLEEAVYKHKTEFKQPKRKLGF